MKRLLDTNAMAALMKGDPQAVHQLRTLNKAEVLLPQPVCAEIFYGIERLPTSKRKARLRARYHLISREITRALWDDSTSEHFGRLKAALERQGKRIEDFDVAIAAHALALSAILVTADGTHMSRVPGLEIENWNESQVS